NTREVSQLENVKCDDPTLGSHLVFVDTFFFRLIVLLMSKRKKVETEGVSSRSSYGLKDLPSSASKFTKEDVEALNATFKSASNESEVIPDVEDFDVDNIHGLSDEYVKTFINNLHRVVVNLGLDIGTDESKTDSLVTYMLTRFAEFDRWPFGVRVKEYYRLFVSDKKVSTKPEFVVDKKGVAMIIVVLDKHLNNVFLPDFGESQMLAEILATILAVRVISSYVTFYKAKIPVAYWKELPRGLPRKQSITILRWPGGNDPKTGLDLAKPAGRLTVLTALIKI
ncbi:4307_t:CDS:2, partial [Gigaspora margarita]